MEIDLSNKGLKGVFDVEQYCKDYNIDVEKVTRLNCGHNKLTELKSLDKLVNLKVLWCSNNKLTELDVSKLVNLKELYCYNNKLTKLDTSNLVNLASLSCHSNKLTELDTSKLVNLKWLNGGEYIQPEQDKLDLLTNRVEKLEQIILEITKGK